MAEWWRFVRANQSWVSRHASRWCSCLALWFCPFFYASFRSAFSRCGSSLCPMKWWRNSVSRTTTIACTSVASCSTWIQPSIPFCTIWCHRNSERASGNCVAANFGCTWTGVSVSNAARPLYSTQMPPTPPPPPALHRKICASVWATAEPFHRTMSNMAALRLRIKAKCGTIDAVIPLIRPIIFDASFWRIRATNVNDHRRVWRHRATRRMWTSIFRCVRRAENLLRPSIRHKLRLAPVAIPPPNAIQIVRMELPARNIIIRAKRNSNFSIVSMKIKQFRWMMWWQMLLTVKCFRKRIVKRNMWTKMKWNMISISFRFLAEEAYGSAYPFSSFSILVA